MSSSKKTVIITGTSSGVGLYAAKSMVERGWHVIAACRNLEKMENAAEEVGISKNNYSTIELDLASLESVRQFITDFRVTGRSFYNFLVLGKLLNHSGNISCTK